MKKQSVFVLTTGGTIEKSYDESDGSLENRQSLLKNLLLSRLRLPHTEVHLQEIMAKDSLFMTDQDREAICTKIQEVAKLLQPIVVLHGTDTMEETANYCYKHFSDPPVPVIFTGAMRPMGFEDSDARQNFTEALMVSQLTQPGIYISFHNCLFEAPNVTKSRELGTFIDR